MRHLSVLGLETYICIRPRRARCYACETEPTTTQVLSWYEQRSPHTKAYDRYLLKQLVNSTIEDVSLSEKLATTPSSVRSIDRLTARSTGTK